MATLAHRESDAVEQCAKILTYLGDRLRINCRALNYAHITRDRRTIYLEELASAIGAAPGSLTLDSRLKDLEFWDSVAYLSVLVLLDEKMGVALGPEQLMGAQTPGDILRTARAGQFA